MHYSFQVFIEYNGEVFLLSLQNLILKIKSEILKQSNLKFQSRLPFTYKIYFLIFSVKLKIVDLINQIICAELDHLLQLDHVAGNQDLLDVVLKQIQQKQ